MSAFEFLHTHSHELEPDPTPDEAITHDLPSDETNPEPSGTLFINAAKGSCNTSLHPGDIHRVLSKKYMRSINLAHTEYKVSYHKFPSGKSLSFMDRGANGGVAGTHVRIILKT
jgi:hypothetical protein